MRTLTTSLAIAAGLLLVASRPVHGADRCGDPDLIETLPPTGATSVPTDASLVARYALSTDYLGEKVVLIEAGIEREVAALFDSSQGMLVVKPPEPLTPGTRFTIRWPALRGIGSATLGRGRSVEFSTGAGPDTETPSFDGVLTTRWNVERIHNACTDAAEERYVFDVKLAAANDDGGRASLTLVVFQTVGPQVGKSPRPVVTRAMPGGDAIVRVELPANEALGKVCFAAIARDLTGKISASGSKEVCTETIAPPFFQGCTFASTAAVGTTPTSAAAVVALMGSAAAAVLVRRRRRRPTNQG